MKKRVLFGILLLAFLLVGLAIRPIDTSSKNSKSISGIVELIEKEGGPYDVQIKLENNNDYFYINRGLENGIDLVDLKRKLVGNEIDLFFAQYWSPLDPLSKHKHVTKITLDNKTLFSEK